MVPIYFQIRLLNGMIPMAMALEIIAMHFQMMEPNHLIPIMIQLETMQINANFYQEQQPKVIQQVVPIQMGMAGLIKMISLIMIQVNGPITIVMGLEITPTEMMVMIV